MATRQSGMKESTTNKLIRLWSVHPPAFRLDDPNQVCDPTLGGYWSDKGFQFRDRYRIMLTELQCRMETTQFIWTWRGLEECFASTVTDEIYWQIDLPPSQILACYDSPAWNDMLYNGTNRWDEVLVPMQDPTPKNVWFLLRWPILPPATVTCLGRPKETGVYLSRESFERHC